MKRLLLGAALAAGFVLGPVSHAQAQITRDTVTYRDKTKKEMMVTGMIQDESPAGIKLMERGAAEAKLIPALDVVHVVYKVAKVTAFEYRQPFTSKEDKALQPGTRPAKRAELLAEALTGYKDLEKQVKDNPLAVRYMQYRAARCLVLIGQGDPTKMDNALKALKAFKDDNAMSWEAVPALELLARLQEEKGDTAGAQKSYEDLADLTGLPAEMKLKANLLVARLLLRNRKFDDAARRLEEAQKALKPGDPNKAYVDVYLAQSQIEQGKLDGIEARLKAAMRDSTDGALKGLAHNALGDYYSRKGQKEDAFWEYLKVDLMYNQDREEQAKAIYNLSKLFDEVKKDLPRAEQCRERLKGKAFEGTVFQRLAALEAKPSGEK